VIFGGTPGTVLYLTSYDLLKRKLPDSPLGHFASGILAEAVACVVYVPVDVVKERLQVQSVHRRGLGAARRPHTYTGSLDAVRKIIAAEGLKGIYRGYGATLLSYGPFSAFYFAFYEQLKRGFQQQQQQQQQQLPFGQIVLSAAGAGSLASWITSPLDMAKLRLQVQRGRGSGNNNNNNTTKIYRNIVHGVGEIYKEGGVRGLWKGAGARVLFHAPSTAITMTVFEVCKDWAEVE